MREQRGAVIRMMPTCSYSLVIVTVSFENEFCSCLSLSDEMCCWHTAGDACPVPCILDIRGHEPLPALTFGNFVV